MELTTAEAWMLAEEVPLAVAKPLSVTIVLM